MMDPDKLKMIFLWITTLTGINGHHFIDSKNVYAKLAYITVIIPLIINFYTISFNSYMGVDLVFLGLMFLSGLMFSLIYYHAFNFNLNLYDYGFKKKATREIFLYNYIIPILIVSLILAYMFNPYASQYAR